MPGVLSALADRIPLDAEQRQVMRLFEVAGVLDRLPFTQAITVGAPVDGDRTFK